jgi:hypothetical protein
LKTPGEIQLPNGAIVPVGIGEPVYRVIFTTTAIAGLKMVFDFGNSSGSDV